MKAKKFITGGLYTKIECSISDLNDEVNDLVLGGITSKRLVMMTLKGHPRPDIRIFEHVTNSLVWIRGDGARYIEPNYIRVNKDHFVDAKRDYSTFKRLFPTTESLNDFIWEDLNARPRVTDLGTISGEFGSSDYSPAIRVGGTIWIKRKWGIEYASPSLLRNSWVWKQKKPAQAAIIQDIS